MTSMLKLVGVEPRTVVSPVPVIPAPIWAAGMTIGVVAHSAAAGAGAASSDASSAEALRAARITLAGTFIRTALTAITPLGQTHASYVPRRIGAQVGSARGGRTPTWCPGLCCGAC